MHESPFNKSQTLYSTRGNTTKDVTSYVIARTLGVVETTRASTNDTDTRAEVDGVLLTQKGRVGDMRAVSKRGLNNDETTTGYALREAGGFDGSKESIAKDRFFEPQPMTEEPSTLYRDHDHEGDLGPPAYFFSPEEEKNLTLSGVNVFSPAVSRQGSPSIERDRSQRITPMPGGSASAYASDLSASSTMLGESFTILESDELADKFSSLRRRGGVSSADPTHTQP